MIIGRAEDRAVIDGILERATGGASSALVVRGDPGVGKTTLLDHAQSQAPGVCVRVRAVASESDFLYAGLHELLQPLLGAIDELPDVQAAALKGALALGEPVPMGRLSVGAATLTLLATAASQSPVVCLIDDAQWLDPSSADALTFAARRLQNESLVMVFAADENVGHPFVAPGLPELRMRGLSSEEAAALLAERGLPAVAPAVLDALGTATGGNALAILEIVPLLAASERSGETPLPRPLPTGPDLAHAMRDIVPELSPQGLDAVRLAAAAATENIRVILRDGDPVTQRGLEEAEDAGVVRMEQGRLTFVHPLAASIVFHQSTPTQQRKALRDVAEGFSVDESYRERRAWNYARAEVVPNEDIAAEIAAVADLANERRGHATAAAFYEAAARLTPDADLAVRRTYAAARSAWLAGQPERLAALLHRLPTTVSDPVLAADLSLLRGRVAMGSGDPEAALDVVDLDLDAVAAVDANKATRLLVLASEASTGAAALELAERATALGATGPTTRVLVRLALSRALVLNGRRTDAVGPLNDALAVMADGEPFTGDPESLADAVWLLGASEVAPSSALLPVVAGVADLAQRHAVVALPAARLLQGDLEARRGRWADAQVAYFEAEQLGVQTGQSRTAGSAAAGMAVLAAHRGRAEECKHLLDVVEANAAWSTADRRTAREVVLGLLALARNQAREAAQLLGAVDPLAATGLLPRNAFTTVDVVEAQLHVDPEAARRRGTDATLDPGSVVGRWTAALLDDVDYAVLLEGVISDLTDHTDPRPFAAARAQLALGERLRRAGRRTDSRILLRAAHETFEELGAEGWAERARNELHATGETARRRSTSGVENLTAQELLVARVIARGATYREAAGQLFLAPKTIEFHMSRVYRKLGITSRHELADRLESHPAAVPA